jgi:hypothetical protein
MVQQQGAEQDFDANGDGGAALWQALKEFAFDELKNREAEEDELFVDFVDRGKNRETEQEEQPDCVDPVDGCALAVDHGEMNLA